MSANTNSISTFKVAFGEDYNQITYKDFDDEVDAFRAYVQESGRQLLVLSQLENLERAGVPVTATYRIIAQRPGSESSAVRISIERRPGEFSRLRFREVVLE
ncbi:MAG: hypothetical protein M3Q07_27815 [Pseudobdellovibrionaceae bacterium]|nr:hypothetical protein [Pseudobdellovibrionaceae bacterium]